MELGSALRRTGVAVAATAVVGGLGTRPRSAWYLALRKPAWQPPAQLFAPVWTTLYAAIAGSTARAMARLAAPDRKRLETALATNLTLNAGWPWLFFTARRPDLALAEVLLLDVSTADLVRRVAAADPRAAGALAPYLAWNLFATALNLAVLRGND